MSEDNLQSRADLLSPVLSAEKPPAAIYSTRAEFFTAFIGGAFAILLFSALNATHLDRLRADLWRYILAAIISVAVIVGVVYLRTADPAPAWVPAALTGEARGAIRWAGRGYALLVWLAFWLPYRRYHKTAEMMGIAPRNPWKAAIACIVAGIAIQFAVAFISAAWLLS